MTTDTDEFDALVDELAAMVTAVDDGQGDAPDPRGCRERMGQSGRRRFDELAARAAALGPRGEFLAWLAVLSMAGARRW